MLEREENVYWPFFMEWPSIQNLPKVKRQIINRQKISKGAMKYRAKIKLHGTNGGINISKRGVKAQSRRMFITSQKDNKDFAKWVFNNKSFWASLNQTDQPVCVFGEWCGEGIHEGAAICYLPMRIFAVFGVLLDRDLIIEPEAIKAFLQKGGNIPEQVRVLPWLTEETVVDLIDTQKANQLITYLNDLVAKIDKEDPWVLENFGVSGVGEGAVWYPTSACSNVNGLLPVRYFETLAIKTKGMSYTMVHQDNVIQLEPQIARDPEIFATMFCTKARFQQGVAEATEGQYDLEYLPQFIDWMVKDVQKESTAELEASKLEFNQVEQYIVIQSRQWYKKKVKDLKRKELMEQKKAQSEESQSESEEEEEGTISYSDNPFAVLEEDE